MRYTTNSKQNVMIPLEMPSCEGGLIHVPSRLGGAIRAEIQSRAMIVRNVPYTEEEIDEAKALGQELQPRFEPRFDPTSAAAELLVQSCIDKRAYTNLTDEEDRPVRITRHWVEFEMDEDDFLQLAQVLFFRTWEQFPEANAPAGEPEDGDGPLDSTEDPQETTDTAGAQPTRSSKSTTSGKRR